MKAFAKAAGSSNLTEMDLPIPVPQKDQVVIAVRAAGVTPTELEWYPTTHRKDGSPRSGAVPGHEFSGTITATGPGVSAFKVGDEIFGMSDWFENGATAEFCLAEQSSIILRPEALSSKIAAAIPIAALTAWQGLVERAKVREGERVFVNGASGSVGLMAVQVARLHGCVVLGSASANAGHELKAIGCQEVLDYRTQPFQKYLSDLDVVFDTVGGDTLATAKPLLTVNGRMVTIAADAESNEDSLIKAAYFTVEPSAATLKHITELVVQNRLRPFVKEVVPFTEAARAYAGQIHTSGLGKLVLSGEESKRSSEEPNK